MDLILTKYLYFKLKIMKKLLEKFIKEIFFWLIATVVIFCMAPLIILMAFCALWYWDSTPLDGYESLVNLVDNAIYNKPITS
jgi:hypothetical protein